MDGSFTCSSYSRHTIREVLRSPRAAVIALETVRKSLEPVKRFVLELLARLLRDHFGYNNVAVALEVDEELGFGHGGDCRPVRYRVQVAVL